MREARDNWAKARATSRREKVPSKHLVVNLTMVVMVNMAMVVKVNMTVVVMVKMKMVVMTMAMALTWNL